MVFILHIKSGLDQLDRVQEFEDMKPRMLHTEGSHLVNDLNERVHLHGVCKNDFIEDSWAYMGGEEGAITHLDTLKAWGCNFLACGVEVQWYYENRYGVRTNIRRLVELAYDRGIYVGIGVFGWDNYGGPSGPWAGNAAGEEILANPQRYIDFWVMVSNDFKDSSNVLYASLAEVAWGLSLVDHGQPVDPPDETKMNQYFDIVCDAVRAIRNNSDEHIFMYHEDYCGYPSRFNKPATEGGEMIRQLHMQFSNIVYDAHVYRSYTTFGGSPDEFDMSTITDATNCDGVYRRNADSPLPKCSGIEDALEFWGYFEILGEYQVPIIMWEGGADAGVYVPSSWEKELTCWKNVLTVLNELDIGYGAFWWRDAWPWALINADLSPTEWGQVLIDAIATRPPTISILSPENKTYNFDNVSLTFTVSELTSWIGYSLDGQINVTISGNTSLPSLLDGSHYVVVYANDTTGDMGASSTVYFAVDTTPPNIMEVSQIPHASNVLPEDEVKVNVTVIDDLSGVKHMTLNCTTDNGTWFTHEMTNLEGNIWNCTIPRFPYCTNVTYVIIAEDSIGNRITTRAHQYQIVPEFSLSFIYPLFMIATLVILIIYRRNPSNSL